MNFREAGTVREASIYVAESGVRLMMAAVVGVFLARYLGPQNFGLLSFATTIFALLAPVASLGMRKVLIREFSTEPDWRPVLVSAMAHQLPVAILVSVLSSVLVIALRGFEGGVVPIAAALTPLPLLGLGDTIRALLEAQGRVRTVAFASLLAATIASGLKLIGVALEGPLWLFALLTTVEALVLFTMLSLGRGLGTNLKLVRTLYSKETAHRLLRESWPLLISGLAISVHMKVDVAMLGILTNDTQTGVYVAAARLSEVWYFLPVAATAGIRPRLARLFAGGEVARYEIFTQRLITVAVWAAIAIAVAIVFLSDVLVQLLYGNEFGDASGILRLHVLASPFVFVGTVSSQWFIDHSMTRAVMTRNGAAAAVNVCLNLLMIPWLGAVGAAASTVVSYALSGVLLNAFFRDTRHLFRLQVRSLRGAWR